MSRISLLIAAAVTSALVACAAADSESSTSSSAQDTVTTTAADASTDASADADASTPALPTYNDVAPLIADHCGTCHHSSFSTLAKVKAHKADMIDVLESHVMPRNDPFWADTPDGQTLLGYLHDSTELQ